MIVLGLGGAVGHDPAAALVIDGNVIAAAEEERFLRDKHAKGQEAEQAALYCLKQAQLGEASRDRGRSSPILTPPSASSAPRAGNYALRHLYTPDPRPWPRCSTATAVSIITSPTCSRC